MSRYSVETLDCAADGMERLRNQSESILLAYACSADVTAESILAELKEDLDSVMRESSFDYAAAREAIQEWGEAGGLRMIEAELREARDAAERGDINWNDESADEFDSWTFRLYLDDSAPDSEELQRFDVCADCMQAVANGLDSIDGLDPEAAAAIESGMAALIEGDGQLVNDCPSDCEGAFSWQACECCKRPEGGARHRIARLAK